MPIHDWRRVQAGIFHDFHCSWIAEIKKALNAGLLPADYYALSEQMAGGCGPDVLTLHEPASTPGPPGRDSHGGIAVVDAPPRAEFHAKVESDIYAAKARSVVIRHLSGHRIVAILEILSPGNKDGRTEFAAFVHKARQALLSGIHLLIVDLFPPTRRDPDGIHRAIWDREDEGDYPLTEDRPLTCASYLGYPGAEVYLQPVAVGALLPDMPLFLTRETYVPVPLEETYQSAWESVPRFWQGALADSRKSGPKKGRRGRNPAD